MTAFRKLAVFVLSIALLVGLGMTRDAQAQSMFTHQIPLKIPKGTNGVQPELGLVYEPSAGNGILGVGWQLTGLSTITRVNYGNGINYNGADTYAHSQLGVLVRQADGSYRSKAESFTKLVPSGTCGDGPCSWIAYDRSGMKYYYGTTADSSLRMWFTGSVSTWALASVVDPFGNSYDVTYAQPALGWLSRYTHMYPSVITYTKGPGLTTYRTVEFGYEDRQDVEPGYYQSRPDQTNSRLKWIYVKSAGQLVRQYRLDYGEYGATTGRSHLTAVQEYGSDGVTTLPAQTFGWQQGGQGLSQQTWPVPNNWGGNDFTWVGDFNGDGKADIASASGGNVYVKLSTGAGFTQQTWPVPNNWGAPGNTWVGDFNGDGKTDIATSVNGNLYVNLSTGSGFTQQGWSGWNSFGSSGYSWVGDFNGDGKADIANLNGGYLYVNLSTGSTYPLIWAVPNNWGSSGYTWVGDFNGDGKTDIATAVGGNIYVNLSTGSGFIQQVWTVPNNWGGSNYTWVGDFNGDGKTDIATANGGNVYVNLSTGSGFAQQVWPVPNYWGDAAHTWVGDFNGDGKTDIATAASGYVFVRLSTGAGFVQQQFWDPNNWGGYLKIGDFNGDGKTDIASAISGNVFINLFPSQAPDLMTSVANGLGGTVTVYYAPASQVSNAIAPASTGPGIPNTAAQQLVTFVSTSDGRGGVYWTYYNYFNSRSYPGMVPDRRNLGFAYIETVDNQTWQRTRTNYRQDPPFEGHVAEVDAFAGNGSLVSQTLHYYVSCPASSWCSQSALGTGTEQIAEYQKIVLTYELGTYASSQTTTNSYDAYGNLSVVSQDAPSLPNVTVTTTYANDAANWILGRITEMKTTSGSTTLAWMKNEWTANTITGKSEWLDATNSWLTTSMSYNSSGNLASVTEPSTGDGLVRTTTTQYDATFHAYPAQVTNALGQFVQRSYNADGLITSVTDANGQVTATTYDVFGRKATETRPDGGATLYSYVNYGSPGAQYNLITTTVDGSRSLSKAEFFDGAGFVYQVRSDSDTNGQYVWASNCKDGAGRPSMTSVPYFGSSPVSCGSTSASWTTTSYDVASRVSSLTTPDGKVSTYSYGKYWTIVTDPNSQVTMKFYDARKRVTSIYQGNQSTSYGYDPLGRLTSVRLPDASVSTVAYDSLNRKTSVTDPQLGTTTYAYDAVGNLTSVTAGGKTVTFTYDALNRVTRKQPGTEAVVTYTYDEPAMANGKGRLTTLVDSGGTTRFAYKVTGQLNNYVKTIDGSNYSQYFTYDYVGRPTRLSYPDGSYADYTYTNGGNLWSLSLNGAIIGTWTNYNAAGKPGKVVYGNSVYTMYDYDVVNHLTSLRTYTSWLDTLQSLTYDWYTLPNTNGLNLGKITDNRVSKIASDGSNTDETQTYAYDALYRLTQAVGVWGTKSYAYDSIGNPTAFGGLTNRTLAFTGQQVISGTGLNGVTYDLAGNMLHKALDGVGWDYTWTTENRLASASRNGLRTAQMVYDADGQRVQKVYTPTTGPTVTTTYVNGMYEKRTYSDGSPQRHTINLYAGGQLVATVTRAGTIATAFNDANRWRTELAAATMFNGHDSLGAAHKIHHLLNAFAMHPYSRRWVVIAFFALFAMVVAVVHLASRKSNPRPTHFAPALRLASLSVVLLFTFTACSGGGPNNPTDLFQASEYLISGDTTKGPAIGTYFYHRNHINSSSVITGANGVAVTRLVYLPYGELSQANSAGGDAVTSKFTGKEYDEEVGLYYYGARYYDPAIGRFISADSVVPQLTDAQAFNRYSYARGNPIIFTDPTGHNFFSDLWNGIKAAASWVANAFAAAVNAIVGAVTAAARWVADAAVAAFKFGLAAAAYAWSMIKATLTNPYALAALIVAAAISVATLNPAPLVIWAQSTAASIAATSVAMAAGVRNPLVLSAIGAVAGAAGGGVTSLWKLLATGAAATGIQALGLDKVASVLGTVSALANFLFPNALEGGSGEAATKDDVVDPGARESRPPPQAIDNPDALADAGQPQQGNVVGGGGTAANPALVISTDAVAAANARWGNLMMVWGGGIGTVGGLLTAFAAGGVVATVGLGLLLVGGIMAVGGAAAYIYSEYRNPTPASIP